MSSATVHSGGVVIVGASHGGVQAAAALRQAGWLDAITLISDEDALPYHRPPLSKAFLTATGDDNLMPIKPWAFYETGGISLQLGKRVTSIDAARKTVTFGDETLSYDKLVLATGAAARKLPLPDFTNLHYLRDLSDARRLRPALHAAAKLVVIGGGFIGLEVAATAAKLGKSVTVLEAQSRLLARALPPAVSDFVTQMHRNAKSRVLFNAVVKTVEGTGQTACAVVLEDGRTFPAGLVVIGVGSLPNTELAASAGLTLAEGGILVDGHMRSSNPDIYAIGDCAACHNPFSDQVARLESVQNAVDQAKAAARHITGSDEPFSAVPWFWSDQFDSKIQMAGLPFDGATEILRGDPATGAFSVLHLEDGVLRAAYSINRAADHMAARKLITSGQLLDTGCAGNPDQPLKDCLASAPAGPVGNAST